MDPPVQCVDTEVMYIHILPQDLVLVFVDYQAVLLLSLIFGFCLSVTWMCRHHLPGSDWCRHFWVDLLAGIICSRGEGWIWGRRGLRGWGGGRGVGVFSVNGSWIFEIYP